MKQRPNKNKQDYFDEWSSKNQTPCHSQTMRFSFQHFAVSHFQNCRFFPTGMTCGVPALKCRMYSNRNYSLSTSSGGPRSIQPRHELYTELSDHLWLYLSNDKCKRQSAISKASRRSRTMTQRSNKKQTGLL
ncbi:uncharacterized protein LOC143449072 isoform X2 [Clavelina lepadiformis]|uniref:uncharacterized protein LOC143449072 isoform X2 n=1 Tax=Clavelina lepadiformis TaxID=159417 RepID=UPI004042EE68